LQRKDVRESENEAECAKGKEKEQEQEEGLLKWRRAMMDTKRQRRRRRGEAECARDRVCKKKPHNKGRQERSQMLSQRAHPSVPHREIDINQYRINDPQDLSLIIHKQASTVARTKQASESQVG